MTKLDDQLHKSNSQGCNKRLNSLFIEGQGAGCDSEFQPAKQWDVCINHYKMMNGGMNLPEIHHCDPLLI